MSVINGCKLEQEEFMSHVWELLNSLFTVLFKKKKKRCKIITK